MASAPGHDQATESRSPAATTDDASSFDSVGIIRPENVRNAIITKAPEERFRLGTWSVIGLVVNRVIGTSKFVGIGCTWVVLVVAMLTMSSKEPGFSTPRPS